jgi:hypothetical protein
MPLTVTPQPSLGYVTVDVTGLTGTIVVTRQTPGGAAVPVRNMEPVGAGVTAVNDRECPFGVPVTYTATYGTSSTATAATQLDATQARLEHPGQSALGKWVRIIADTPPVWESPSVVHNIINRPDPLVTAQTLRARSGTLRLWCATQAEANEVLQLFQSGYPVLVRTPQPRLLRDGWLAPVRITDAHERADLEPRIIEVEYQVVGRPIGDSVGQAVWRWQDQTTEYGTWAILRNAYPTWSLAVAGPATIGSPPE